MLGFSFIVLSAFILIIVLSLHFVPSAFPFFNSAANKHTFNNRLLDDARTQVHRLSQPKLAFSANVGETDVSKCV
jgi:hypothetical protein